MKEECIRKTKNVTEKFNSIIGKRIKKGCCLIIFYYI